MNEIFILLQRIESKHKREVILSINGNGDGEVWFDGHEGDFDTVAELRVMLYRLFETGKLAVDIDELSLVG